MKIEAGKYYRTRDGGKAYVAGVFPDEMGFAYPVTGCVFTEDCEKILDMTDWAKDGKDLWNGDWSLIAEWEESVQNDAESLQRELAKLQRENAELRSYYEEREGPIAKQLRLTEKFELKNLRKYKDETEAEQKLFWSENNRLLGDVSSAFQTIVSVYEGALVGHYEDLIQRCKAAIVTIPEGE